MNFTPTAKQRAIETLNRALAIVNALPATTPCSGCGQFEDGFCHHWKAKVPVDAQADGCEQWEEEIPF